MMTMEYRATITVRRPRPISQDDYQRVLAALDRRHEEFGAVGGGGDRNTAVFVLSTDHHGLPAPAAGELVGAVIDALEYVDLADAWPVLVELEEVESDEEHDEPRRVAVG